jgi:hypothetical protein
MGWELSGSHVAAEPARTSEPALGLTAATLDIRAVASHLDVRAAELGDELFEYAGQGAVASVDRAASVVHARHTRSWLGPPHPPDIAMVLNARIAWTVRIRASGLNGSFDLRRLRLQALDLRVDSARFRTDLPVPTGPVQLRITGRSVDATLSVPEGIPVRLWREDGWRTEGTGTPQAAGDDRYDVWLQGSAARCRLEAGPAAPAGSRRPTLTVLS